ncbi:hypothetical protein PMI41_00971 [Phyllobacterium sp. YR531]|nr:hypothetical protein PMI41_00971 [Phyllobacterium sp. YR531]
MALFTIPAGNHSWSHPSWFLGPAREIAVYLAKRRSRLALSNMTSDQLRDIGITPDQAEAEIAKSWFWI